MNIIAAASLLNSNQAVSFAVSDVPILDARAVKADYGQLLVLTADGALHGIDLDTGEAVELCWVSLPELPAGDQGSAFDAPAYRLHASADGKFAAVVVDGGREGIVVDIATGEPTMLLAGGDYYSHTVPFSACFTRFQGRNVLIHRTAWNRLDAVDPATGEAFASREIAAYEMGGERPEHYLDYFHGQLRPSPRGSRIFDDGWVWQPLAVPRIWSLREWLASNPWESEDGPSIVDFPLREDWNIPACWLDERRIALWGLSDWDEEEFEEVAKGPGIQIFDAESKEPAAPERWPMDLHGGKVREMFSDGQRLYIADEAGSSAWDIASRTQLAAWPGFAARVFDAERGMLFAIGSTTIAGLQLPWVIEKSMFELSERVRPYFEQAGWTPGDIGPDVPQSPREKAMALLGAFGGLSVGSVGAGIELASSDVCFYSELKPKASALLKAWQEQTGEVEAFATAHHDHIIVYVGAHGFYAFTDPDGKLYDLGPEFSPAMEKLLLGLEYGAAMAPD